MEGLSSAPAPTGQDQEQRGTVTPGAAPGVTPRGSHRPGQRLAGHGHAWRGGQQVAAVPLPRDALGELKSELAQRDAAGQWDP